MCAKLIILDLKCQRYREANVFPQVSSGRSVTRESIPGAGALLGSFLQIIRTLRGSGHTGTAVGDFLPSSNTRPPGCPLTQDDPSAAPPPTTSTIGPSWAGSLAKESSSLQTSSVEAQRAKVFHLKRSESRACSWPSNAALFQKERMKPIFRVGKEENLAVSVEIQPWTQPALRPSLSSAGLQELIEPLFGCSKFKLSFHHLQLKEFREVSYCHPNFTERETDAQRS